MVSTIVAGGRYAVVLPSTRTKACGLGLANQGRGACLAFLLSKRRKPEPLGAELKAVCGGEAGVTTFMEAQGGAIRAAAVPGPVQGNGCLRPSTY